MNVVIVPHTDVPQVGPLQLATQTVLRVNQLPTVQMTKKNGLGAALHK